MSHYPFRRLQSELAEMINSLPAETRLPSEPALAKQLGVSRATLREAMRSFEGQGMIRRRQGVGTFVAAKVPVMDTGLEVLESIETIAQRSGPDSEDGRVADPANRSRRRSGENAEPVSVGAELTQVSAHHLHRPPPDRIPGRHPADGHPGG